MKVSGGRAAGEERMGGGGVLNLSSFDQDGLDGNEGSDEEEVTHAPLPV